MGQGLEKHVAQSHFKNPVVDAIINVSIASSFIKTKVDDACLPVGITGAQYHVLRILSHAPLPGFSRNDVLKRLVEKSVDVTRSINNLIVKGFVTRRVDATDRRIVLHSITPSGNQVLVEIDVRLRVLMTQISTLFTEEELGTLSLLCERLSSIDE